MKKTVALILEGTYPYARGGVGMWAQDLVRRSPQYDFLIVALTDGPRGPRDVKFALPSHVRQVIDVDLNVAPTRPSFFRGWFRRKETERLALDLAAALESAAQGDGAGFRAILRLWDKTPLRHRDVLHSPAFWQFFTRLHEKMGGDDSLSRFFWAWDLLTRRLWHLLSVAPVPADVYHCASTGYAGLLGALWKARTGKPLLVTEHGLYLQERQMELAFHEDIRGTQRRLFEAFFEGVSRWVYGEADRLTSLCQPIQSQQVALGADPAKTVVLPNGIDVDAFGAIQRRPAPGFHIGLVGRVVPVKDIKLLLLAARELLPAIPDLKVSIKGSWDDPDYYDECRDLVTGFGFEDRVRFTGHQEPAECYADIDVLVICSLKEVQPLAVLEAMAAGVPVIATRSGGVPEMLSNAGWVIAPRDLGQLVKAVRRVHDDAGLRARMAKRGRERVRSSYHIDQTMTNFHGLYQNLLEKPWPVSV